MKVEMKDKDDVIQARYINPNNFNPKTMTKSGA